MGGGGVTEKLVFISTAGGYINWYDPFEKQVGNINQEPYKIFPFSPML